ncbi:MAG: hypothetical protein BGO98_45540 [Myxococcales bacterium 68-20]|nr:hypothetical protein [Myxococcales bacterium]OJY31144.1 MAG: hypothetical protein BGO98_45540 [Myxococcales bacterium 68-20]
MKIWLRPLPFALLAAYGLSRLGRAPVDDAAPSRSAALCTTLAEVRGVTCDAADVVWLDGPSGVLGAIGGKARALVRGRERSQTTSDPNSGAPADPDTLDLFSVTTRLSPEGHLLDVGDAHNLTRSTGADEGLPVTDASSSRVAYLVEVDGHPEAVHVLDLAGHDRHAYDELTKLERFQVKIADLQATGQTRGVKKTVFTLVPPPRKASIAFLPGGMLEVKGIHGADDTSDVRVTTIDAAKGTVADADAANMRVTAEVVAKPPTFGPWMSDRLRAASWFGDEKNQVLKAVVFTTMEWVKGTKAQLTGDTGEEAAQEDLGSLPTSTPFPSNFTDPEIGWPPKPLVPMIKPAIAGEGQWIRLDDDPFITPIPGLPSPFVTTFVRSDPSAQHTRVYVTLWDPRLIALHMEAGTVEPVSATGAAGPGKIPRTPETIRRVVGGFNGGFQATHGEFGMQANGVLYLPPKPYAATVAELRDGTTAFAAWPKDQEVPEEILSFRQNMTFMVQNDKYNPWGRAWWGGVPPGWQDAIHTTRSGLCLTKEGFVAYLFGHDIGPEPLGRAMLAARCQVGMHLDMNPGLAGFEFYNMQSASTFKPLGRPLQKDWEHEGTVKDMPEFKFRSRRMTKSMGHILFPRYIQRDARDFFYLTARHVLPGEPIAPGAEWRVKGLPQHGYPYASAITSVTLPTAGERRVRVLRLDPRAVAIASDGPTGDGENAQTVAIFGRAPRAARGARGAREKSAPGDAGAPSVAPADAAKKLWLGQHIFTIDEPPTPNAVAITSVVQPSSSSAANARGAVGVSDEDGMLQWVELLPEDAPSAETSAAMLALLERIGCSSRGLLMGDLRAYLGGTLDIGGEPAAPAAVAVKLTRTPSPAAKQIFESTPIVPQAVWQPLQKQRVKWRPTLAPPEKPASSASSGPAPSTPSSPPPL